MASMSSIGFLAANYVTVDDLRHGTVHHVDDDRPVDIHSKWVPGPMDQFSVSVSDDGRRELRERVAEGPGYAFFTTVKNL